MPNLQVWSTVQIFANKNKCKINLGMQLRVHFWKMSSWTDIFYNGEKEDKGYEGLECYYFLSDPLSIRK